MTDYSYRINYRTNFDGTATGISSNVISQGVIDLSGFSIFPSNGVSDSNAFFDALSTSGRSFSYSRGALVLRFTDGDDFHTITITDFNTRVGAGYRVKTADSGEANFLVSQLVRSLIGQRLVNVADYGVDLDGGAGADIFVGGENVDTLDGHAGFDTAVYTAASGGITFDATSTATDGFRTVSVDGNDANDKIKSIEKLVGTKYGDTFTVGVNDGIGNRFDGGAGNDIFTVKFDSAFSGKYFGDNLRGDIGLDTLSLVGENNAGALVVNLFRNTMAITIGEASPISQTISSFENLDLSATTYSTDKAFAFVGSHANNVLTFGDGAMDIVLLNALGGRDTLDLSNRASGVHINQLAGVRQIGGKSLDAYEISGGGFATGSRVRNFEEIIGTDRNDFIFTNLGRDKVSGGAGNDWISVGKGNDKVDGGDGADTIDYSIDRGRFDGVNIDLKDATEGDGELAGVADFRRIYNSREKDTLTNIENIIGTNARDILTGNSADNVIFGGRGNDVIDGEGGADILVGGGGDDTFLNLGTTAGADQVDGGFGEGDGNGVDPGFNTADFSGAGTIDANSKTFGIAVDLSRSVSVLFEGGVGGPAVVRGLVLRYDGTYYVSGDGIAQLHGIEKVIGTAYDDRISASNRDSELVGGEGDDKLYGGTGSDKLYGGEGVDELFSGAGNDILYGEAGDDRLFSEAGGTSRLEGGDGYDEYIITKGSTSTIFDSDARTSDRKTNIDLKKLLPAGDGSTFNDLPGDTAGENLLFLLEQGFSFNRRGLHLDIKFVDNSGVETKFTIAGFYQSADKYEFTFRTTSDANTKLSGEGFTQLGTSVVGTIPDDGGEKRLAGSNVNDILTGRDSAEAANIDNIYGFDGNDRLLGLDGADKLYGGAGDDTLDGGAGGDTIDGGKDVDTISYAGSTAGVNYDFTKAASDYVGVDGDAAGDKVSNVERVIGSGEGDTFTLSTETGGRNDIRFIQAGAGDDTVNLDIAAGAGRAGIRLVGGAGSDTLALEGVASSGIKSLVINLARGRLAFVKTDAPGVTHVVGIGGFENVKLTDAVHFGKWTVVGNNAANKVILAGDSGGTGITGSISLLGGNDEVEFATGTDITLLNLRIDGGTGSDTIDFSRLTDNLNIDLPASYRAHQDIATDVGYVANAQLIGIENVVASAARALTFTGNGAANIITGSIAVDTIDGGGGVDRIRSREGSDNIKADRSDIMIVDDAADSRYDHLSYEDHTPFRGRGVTIDLSASIFDTVADLDGITRYVAGRFYFGSDDAGFNSITGSRGNDNINAGNRVVELFGGAGNDRLTSGSRSQKVEGQVGNDILVLGAVSAEVTLDGGVGNDQFLNLGFASSPNKVNIVGGDGIDVVDFSSGLDFGIYKSAEGYGVSFTINSDQVRAIKIENGAGTAIADDAGIIVKSMSGIENAIGSDNADSITGDGVDNVIDGLGGDDLLDGGAGADILYGGDGVDTLDGGAGADSLYGGVGVDTLDGDTGADILYGGAGGDTLDGGAGADRLYGGAGADTLKGGDSLSPITDDSGVTTTPTNIGGRNEFLNSDGTSIAFGRASAYATAPKNILLGGSGGDTYEIAPNSINEIADRDGGTIVDFSEAGVIRLGGNGGAGDGRLLARFLQIDFVEVDSDFDNSFKSQRVGNDLVIILTKTAEEPLTLSGVELTKSTFSSYLTTDDAYQTVTTIKNFYAAGFAGRFTFKFKGTEEQRARGTDPEVVEITGGQFLNAFRGSVVEGSAADNVITGLGRNDNIKGNGGADEIYGGGGADTIRGGAGEDEIVGGAQNDILYGDGDDDGLYGGAGNDRLDGGAGNDELYGEDGNDRLEGGVGDDELQGEDGNDRLDGGAGDDDLYGEDGADTLLGGKGRDELDGGDGDDKLYGGAGDDKILDGGDDNDLLDGGAGNDDLRGGEGDDTFINLGIFSSDGTLGGDSASGVDTIDGGDGIDIADFSKGGLSAGRSSGFGIKVDLSTSEGTSEVNGATVQNVADVTLNRASDTTPIKIASLDNVERVDGTKYADEIAGDAKDNIIRGFGGADILGSGGGNNELEGGGGADTYKITAGSTTTVLDSDSGRNGVRSTIDLTDLDALALGSDGEGNIEKFVLTEAVEISRVGNDLQLTITTGKETAAAGDDVTTFLTVKNFYRAAGSYDFMFNIKDGTADAEEITIKGGSFSFPNNDRRFLRSSDAEATLDGDELGNDILVGRNNVDFKDTLNGGGGDDRLSGLAGADTLNGGRGGDILIGGAGGDVLDGGSGTDTADYRGSNAGVVMTLAKAVDAEFADVDGGHAAGDTIKNIERIIGSKYNDEFTVDAQSASAIKYEVIAGGGADSLTVDFGTGASENVVSAAIDFNAGVGADTLILEGKRTLAAAADSLSIGLGADAFEDGAVNLLGFENIDLTSFTSNANVVEVTGSSVANTVTLGDLTSVSLDTQAGNDIVKIGDEVKGITLLDGGAGSDTLDFSSRTKGVALDLALVTGTLTGTEASSTLSSVAGSIINFERIIGSAQGDTLSGGAGVNILLGEAGDDTLQGGAGSDVINGGEGDGDTVSYAGEDTGVRITLRNDNAAGNPVVATFVRVRSREFDRITNVENIRGSEGNDILVGNRVANRLEGGAGDDIITGGGGADELLGGAGADTIKFSTSVKPAGGDFAVDVVDGGDDEDTADFTGIYFQDGGARSRYGIKVDLTSSEATAEAVSDVKLNRAAPNDDIKVASLDNIENVYGTGLADVITGGAGANVIKGNGGSDVIDGGAGIDTIYGGAGGDELKGGEDGDEIYGEDGNDDIYGGGGTNTLRGGRGADNYFIKKGSTDTIIDGSGISTIDLTDVGTFGELSAGVAGTRNLLALLKLEGVSLEPRDGTNNLVLTIEKDSLTTTLTINNFYRGATSGTYRFEFKNGAADTETVTFNGREFINIFRGDRFTYGEGEASGAVLEGGFGNDIIVGRNDDSLTDDLRGAGGNDRLIGLIGADKLDGGEGDADIADYRGSNAGVVITLAKVAGADFAVAAGGHAAGDTIKNIEVIHGSNPRGGGFGDEFTLFARNQVDYKVYGNNGADKFIIDFEGVTSDTGDHLFGDLYGGAQLDTLALEGANTLGDISINFLTGRMDLGREADKDSPVVSGFENLDLSGYTSDASATDGKSLTFVGTTGNNRVALGGFTTTGSLSLDGGRGADTLDFTGRTVAITLNLGLDAAEVYGTDNSIKGFEHVVGGTNGDTITGSRVNNVLDGGDGNDRLSGGGGNDRLLGGDNADILLGGAGNDRLLGGGGGDTLQGGAGNDFIDGGEGFDTVTYEGERSGVRITLKDDTATGNPVNAYFRRGYELDTIRNVENIRGSAVNDVLVGNSAANRLEGLGGNDIINGGGGFDTILGGDNDDIVRFGGITDIEYATGRNSLFGTADGGLGKDTLDLSRSSFLDGGTSYGFAVTLINNWIFLKSNGAPTERNIVSVIRFENVDGSSYADVIKGDGGANVIKGNGGIDIITGNGGADELYGGAGGDTLIGNAGDDKLYGGDGIDTLRGGDGTNELRGGRGRDTYSINSGSSDTIYDTGGDIVLTGLTGAASTAVNVGALVAGGGTFARKISGRDWTFIFTDGAKVTTLTIKDFAIHHASYTFKLASAEFSGSAIRGASEGKFIGSSGADRMVGGSGAQEFYGLGGNDILGGGDGDDTLTGGAGDDRFVGLGTRNSGTDTIDGGAGQDVADFSRAGAIVTLADNTRVNAGVTVDISNFAAANDVTGGRDADAEAEYGSLKKVENIIGSGFADTITLKVSDASINSILLGSGNDRLVLKDAVINEEQQKDVYNGGRGVDTLDLSTMTSDGITNFIYLTNNDPVPKQKPEFLPHRFPTDDGDAVVNPPQMGTDGVDTLTGSEDYDDTLIGGAGDDIYIIPADISFRTTTVRDDGGVIDLTAAEILGKNAAFTVNNFIYPLHIQQGALLSVAFKGDLRDGDLHLSPLTKASLKEYGKVVVEDFVDNAADFEFHLLGPRVAGVSERPVTILNGGDVLATGNIPIYVPPADLIPSDDHAKVGANDGYITRVKYSDSTNTDITEYDQVAVARNFENVKGSSGNDRIFGTNGANKLEGGGGDDQLVGDTIRAGRSNGNVVGGNDELYGGDGKDVLYGMAGNDYLDGGVGIDVLFGGRGNDIFKGGSGADEIYGGLGSDTLSYEDGSDGVVIDLSGLTSHSESVTAGGAGASEEITSIENIIGSEVGDVLTGSNAFAAGGGYAREGDGYHLGAYPIDADGDTAGFQPSELTGFQEGNRQAFGGANKLEGRGGNDILKGLGGNDVLLGGDGNDVLDGGRGSDRLNGGDGIDTISYEDGVAGVTITLRGAINAIFTRTGSGEFDTIRNVENIKGTEFRDILTGDGLANKLEGLGGNDAIRGGAGNDNLLGGAGNDVIRGGTGDDIIGGGADDDTIYGDAGTNTITGGDGKDTIYGGTGVDNIDGGAGDDAIYGGNGLDTIDGGTGDDTIKFSSSTSYQQGEGTTATFDIDVVDGGANTDTADFSKIYFQDGGVRNRYGIQVDLTDFVGTSNVGGVDVQNVAKVTLNRADNALQVASLDNIENVYGTNLADVITGGAGVNVIKGNGGDDKIYGGDGVDTIDGGTGNDVIEGGDGNDVIDGGTGNDVIDGGTGNDVIDGGIGNDILDGEAGDDIITGGVGNDHIHGGAGINTLTGGRGADTYYIAEASENIITDVGGVIDLTDLGDIAKLNDLTLANLQDKASLTSFLTHLNAGTGGSALGLDTTGLTINIGKAAAVSTDPNIVTSIRLEGFTLANAGSFKFKLSDGKGGSYDVKGTALTAIISSVQRTTAADKDLTGGVFSDRLVGRNGQVDTLEGGDGGDTLLGFGGNDILDGDGGNDLLNGGAGVDTMDGGAGNDILNGGDGVDTMNGDDGNDILNGGAGADIIDGGVGEDTASYAVSNRAVTLALTADQSSIAGLGGHAEGDTISNVEKFIGTRFGDTFTLAAADVTKSYTLEAGRGFDTLKFSGTSATFAINLVAGTFSIGGSDSKISNIERIDISSLTTSGAQAASIAGSDGVDNIVIGDDVSSYTNTATNPAGISGSLGADNDILYVGNYDIGSSFTLTGGEGFDTINFLARTDTTGAIFDFAGSEFEQAIGSKQDDIFTSDNNANRINGGLGQDTIDYSNADSFVVANLGTVRQTGSVASQGDILSNIENILGTDYSDILIGSRANNVITGGGGADTIKGGAGIDTVSYEGSSAVNVDLNGVVRIGSFNYGYGSGGDAEGDKLLSIENIIGSDHGDTLTGNRLANRLEGGDGGDILIGGAGNDILTGGASSSTQTDTLRGGAGRDTYLINSGDGKNNVITDDGGVVRFDFTATDSRSGDDLVVTSGTDANSDGFTITNYFVDNNKDAYTIEYLSGEGVYVGYAVTTT